MTDKEEDSTFKVYISIFEETKASASRFLKPLLLDSFETDEEAMECVISLAKEAGVKYWTRDDKPYLGQKFMSPYWRELIEKIYNE
jgi:hypothetical protein